MVARQKLRKRFDALMVKNRDSKFENDQKRKELAKKSA
jgi:hypothetical protein